MQPYAFNKDSKYQAGAFYKTKSYDFQFLPIFVSESANFTSRVRDIFSQYQVPNVRSNHVVDLWGSAPMGFWQNQLNFALWCSTTGCGVGNAHLTHPSKLTRSLYIFHGYYQTRRIMEEMSIALPDAATFDAYENAYNRQVYSQICREFNLDAGTDWRRRGLPNYGLGKVYTAGVPQGDGWFYPNHVFGWRGSGANTIHDARAPSGWLRESFTDPGDQTTIHVDYIAQDGVPAWTTFIADETEGFTQAGIERLNESIRTYVWAILGAQAQTRSTILAVGTGFDTQKRFLELLEDAMSSPVDVASSITRYQSVLGNAHSKVDYVFGYDLYMAPSDMQLRIGQIDGYNNKIVTASKDMLLGSNAPVNASAPPPAPIPHRGPLPIHHEQAPLLPVIPLTTTSPEERAIASQHNNEKTALIVGSLAVGLLALWFIRRP